MRRDIDIDVSLGCKTVWTWCLRRDDAYLEVVERALHRAVEIARPDLVVYQAGVDCLAKDALGKLSLSRQGLRDRNALVYDLVCRRLGLPIVVCMGGGYCRPIAPTVAAHADVYLQLIEVATGANVLPSIGD